MPASDHDFKCRTPARHWPLIDVGLPGHPQFILMLSDAQPIVQQTFRHWHGQIDDEDDTDDVSWTSAHVWAMFLADFASILDQL